MRGRALSSQDRRVVSRSKQGPWLCRTCRECVAPCLHSPVHATCTLNRQADHQVLTIAQPVRLTSFGSLRTRASPFPIFAKSVASVVDRGHCKEDPIESDQTIRGRIGPLLVTHRNPVQQMQATVESGCKEISETHTGFSPRIIESCEAIILTSLTVFCGIPGRSSTQ